MLRVIKAGVKTAIPLTSILLINLYAQQLLGWAMLILVVVVGIVVVSLIVFVSLALRFEKALKALISLIKAVKH